MHAACVLGCVRKIERGVRVRRFGRVVECAHEHLAGPPRANTMDRGRYRDAPTSRSRTTASSRSARSPSDSPGIQIDVANASPLSPDEPRRRSSARARHHSSSTPTWSNLARRLGGPARDGSTRPRASSSAPGAIAGGRPRRAAGRDPRRCRASRVAGARAPRCAHHRHRAAHQHDAVNGVLCAASSACRSSASGSSGSRRRRSTCSPVPEIDDLQVVRLNDSDHSAPLLRDAQHRAL